MTPLAALLALSVGLSLGLLGGGGSILTVPIFRYALGLGVKESIGMSLGVVSATSLVGALRHWHKGNLDLKALVAFAPAAILSTYGGAKLAHFVPPAVQMVGLGFAMATAAILMWSGGIGALADKGATAAPPESRSPRPEALIGLGLGLGFMTGILGVGGGFLIVPALVVLLGLEMKQAIGTSLGVIALNAAAGFVGYLGQVEMNWPLMAGFTLAAIAGVFAGAALVPKVSTQQLRRGFSVFLILVAIYILIRR
ncbi:MAG TPA: sulfite exporter TauE/SafE family protein [Gemmatimonadales bacterium]|nr:sulfite exporter TauE/SafE family protein [Gemmatimonadales bacterium]